MRHTRLVALLLLLLPALTPAAAPAGASGEAVLVYLVRHAERAEDGTEDPPISIEGEARAHALAALLADAGVDHVHSTDFLRTRQTVAPLLAATGLPLRDYDPSDLPAFAEVLRATPGRHLVVGHSDTTPDLVAALGGEPGAAIEHMEYDRLYVVVLQDHETISTVLLRFGAPSQPAH